MVHRYFKHFIFIIIVLAGSFGRVSAQSNCQCWQTRDTTFHPVPFAWDSTDLLAPPPPYYRNDDAVTNAIKLPFTFCFWGKNVDSVYINNNGNVSFGSPWGSYTSDSFPLKAWSMVAPFWGDVDTRNSSSSTPSGIVWYKLTPTYLIVQWDSVGYYAEHTDKRNTFQVIISNGKDPIIPYGNNVEFCYKTMQWTTGDASGGTNGFGGFPATVGANEGDGVNFVQFGLFDTAGAKYKGEFPPPPSYDGVAWLNNQGFLFNTCATSIPPIVSGVSPCDTLILCMGDTLDLDLSFLSPKASDSTHANLMPPILPGVSIKSNTAGNTDNMVLQIIGSTANYGLHDITVYGYDNEKPPDTTFVTFVLEVDSSASGSIVASKDTICPGDSVKLKGVTNGTNYSWSTGQTTDSIEVKPTSTTVYTLQVYKGKCPLTLVKQVVVLNGGSIKASDDTICAGDSTTLTVYNATSYKWNTGATTSSIKVAPPVTTTYTVITGSKCKTDTLTLKVLVNPLPKVTLTSPDSVCKGSSTTISAGGGTSYKWSTGATTSSITVTPSKDSVFNVMVSNGTCVKDTSVTVIVKPLPVPVITAKPDTICVGDSAMLVGGGGGSYVWPATGQTTDTIWVKPGTTTSYPLQVTLDGCVATTTKQVVVVGSVVPTLTIANDSICQGDSTTLTATGGGTYKWLPGGATTATITAKPGVTTTYSVVIGTPCGLDTLSKKLNVLPYPKIILSGNTSICAGKTVTIKASGGGTYSWSTGATADSIIVSPTSSQVYNLSVSNGKCSKDTSVKVTVNQPPPVGLTPNQKVCKGSQVTFTDTAKGATSYTWSNGGTTSSITVTPPVTSSYTVYASANGCLDSAVGTVVVVVPSSTACCDTTIIAGASASIYAAGPGAMSYQWEPDPSSLSCYTCPNPVASPTVTTTYTVAVTDSNGCVSDEAVTIFVECLDFTVPNIFTPNNDGINDDFVPYYTAGGTTHNGVGNMSDYSIVIYDRWGKEVYSSTDATKYWNGTLNNSSYLVPDGVYYYIIKATCGGKSYDKHGFVEVVGGK